MVLSASSSQKTNSQRGKGKRDQKWTQRVGAQLPPKSWSRGTRSQAGPKADCHAWAGSWSVPLHGALQLSPAPLCGDKNLGVGAARCRCPDSSRAHLCPAHGHPGMGYSGQGQAEEWAPEPDTEWAPGGQGESHPAHCQLWKAGDMLRSWPCLLRA